MQHDEGGFGKLLTSETEIRLEEPLHYLGTVLHAVPTVRKRVLADREPDHRRCLGELVQDGLFALDLLQDDLVDVQAGELALVHGGAAALDAGPVDQVADGKVRQRVRDFVRGQLQRRQDVDVALLCECLGGHVGGRGHAAGDGHDDLAGGHLVAVFELDIVDYGAVLRVGHGRAALQSMVQQHVHFGLFCQLKGAVLDIIGEWLRR